LVEEDNFTVACIVLVRGERRMPYIYIDRVLNELRSELLSAMHQAVSGQFKKGEVDVNRLYRSFTRAAAGQVANPAHVSDKCVVSAPKGVKGNPGSSS
jgi:hypothetical protein